MENEQLSNKSYELFEQLLFGIPSFVEPRFECFVACLGCFGDNGRIVALLGIGHCCLVDGQNGLDLKGVDEKVNLVGQLAIEEVRLVLGYGAAAIGHAHVLNAIKSAIASQASEHVSEAGDARIQHVRVWRQAA